MTDHRDSPRIDDDDARGGLLETIQARFAEADANRKRELDALIARERKRVGGKPSMLHVVTESRRECGACTECCTVLEVKELGKAAGVPCQHLVGGGCGIYDKRPQVCADWQCLWLERKAQRSMDRPDNSGVVVSVSAHDEAVNKALGVRVLIAHETEAGAFDHYRGQRILRQYVRRALVHLVSANGKREWAGPQRWLSKLQNLQKVDR